MRVAAVWLGALICLAAPASSAVDALDPSEDLVLHPVKGQPRDLIEWRKLSREDFEGEEPPAELLRHAALIGAVSCVGIGLPSDAAAVLTVEQLPTGEARHVARLYRPRFTAVFDRLCSWWNPGSGDLEYLLEHEQLHFDLTELAARELTRDVRGGNRELMTRAATPETALAKLDAQVGIATRQAMRDLQVRHARLDEETSVTWSHARQGEWAERVGVELEQSAAWAAGSGAE